MTGIYTPTEGKIIFDGKEITGKKPFRIVQGGIARTFQNLRIFGNLTVIDNIRIARHFTLKSGLCTSLLRLPSFRQEEAEVREEAMQLIRLMNLEDRAFDDAKNLPYGALRRLEIARALATRPKLVLLDEPAAGMNPKETDDLMGLIRRIRDEFKVTVFPDRAPHEARHERLRAREGHRLRRDHRGRRSQGRRKGPRKC